MRATPTGVACRENSSPAARRRLTGQLADDESIREDNALKLWHVFILSNQFASKRKESLEVFSQHTRTGGQLARCSTRQREKERNYLFELHCFDRFLSAR